MARKVFRWIGLVKNNQIDIFHKVGEWADTVSRIVLAPDLKEALDGIEEYSHIVVIFWMDQVKEADRTLKKIIPYERKEIGPKGIFATRMPERPNPIGVTIVRLLRIEGNTLEVLGLDAFNNTPVLDIKPYNGFSQDLVFDFKCPQWEKGEQDN